MSNTNNATEATATEATEVAKAGSATYSHKFIEPFTYLGKSYQTMDFHFGKLTGRDSLAIYTELRMQGVMVITPRTSQDYQLRLAAKACGLGADAFETMSLRDFEVILNAARNFIPASAF